MYWDMRNSWSVTVDPLLIYCCQKPFKFFWILFFSLFISSSSGASDSEREEKTVSLLLLWQKVSKDQTSARTPSEPCSWDGTISMQVSVTSVVELEGAELINFKFWLIIWCGKSFKLVFDLVLDWRFQKSDL